MLSARRDRVDRRSYGVVGNRADQHSGSAIIPAPDDLTKDMLGIAFTDQPAARLGGARSVSHEQLSCWARARRRIGF